MERVLVAVPSAWSLVALCRRRLNARFAARSGWVVAALIAVAAYGLAATVARSVPSTMMAAGAARWIAIAMVPLLLVVSAGPAKRDRDDGIEALCILRGGSGAVLALGRVIAAAVAVATRVGLPSILLCAALAAFGEPLRLAAAAVGLAGFAVAAGVLLGGLAAVCGEVAGPRGRELFLLLIVLPWVVADRSGPGWSVPTLLGASLEAIGTLGGTPP